MVSSATAATVFKPRVLPANIAITRLVVLKLLSIDHFLFVLLAIMSLPLSFSVLQTVTQTNLCPTFAVA